MSAWATRSWTLRSGTLAIELDELLVGDPQRSLLERDLRAELSAAASTAE